MAGIIKGRDIADEQLRQLCIYNTTNENIWFKYMNKFKQICNQPTEWVSCGRDKIYKSIGISADLIDKCVKNAANADKIYPALEI